MRVLEEVYAPHGFNVGFNQGRVAGAGVEHHIHLHVVPRWGGDTNFMPVLADTRVMPQTLEQSYEALTRHALTERRPDAVRRSSRPTTSAASTARRWTATPPTCSAAPSPACSPTCAASRPPSCGSGSAATCGCRRRRWRRGCATGWSPRAPPSLDAGMVGTEMLYYLVGSRELDGGAMVTASHNPKAYTGVKLVREGALALSGDAGIGDVRDLTSRRARRRPRRRRRSRRSTSTTTSSAHALSFIDAERGEAAEGRRRRRQRDGRADGRPAARAPRRSTWSRPTGCPTASSPTTSRTRCCPRTASSSSTGCWPRAPTSASPGTATPTAASSSTTSGEFVDGDFLTALLAELVLAQGARRRRSSTTCAPAARSPTRSRAAGGTPHVNRVGHAFFKQAMREHDGAFGGEVSGHYYFRDFWYADSGTIPALLVLELLSASRAGRSRSWSASSARRYFISGEINSEVADQEAKMKEIAERYADAEISLARRRLGRLPGLALQRPALEHRAAAAPQPRVAGLARGHGAEARRGPGADPLVSVTTPTARLEAEQPPGATAEAAGIRAADPDPVRGRPGQLLPDRGRAADPGRHRPELGQGARRARAPARRRSGTRSRTSS